MTSTRLHLILAVSLALSACNSSEKQKAAAEAAAAAQAAAKEQKAQEIGKQFDAKYAEKNWVLAAAHGEELVVMHPDSPVTARIRAQYEEAKAKVGETREQQRMAALWEYQSVPVKGGNQLSAAIYSKKPIDTGFGTPYPVRLIFRDHPSWGRSSYLVLENGDFDCYGGCKVQVTLDNKAPKAMAASRPKTDEAIAMFIEDERALWRMAGSAKTMTIEFPVKMGGKRSALFEVGGLDKGKLPKW
ncbi:hypothetical protein [Lysobacter sp. Root494]|uniref:hypothetical protein n=1 Tax=Lysobacter sp. Root494 TaxID=1736549 RepID=UPI0006F3F575|nr:hypothetical protein [Lysobacter sp. Root494]KQY54950.1 hypothetical protein ASD14_01940 [Lysobacter sp. Root494]